MKRAKTTLTFVIAVFFIIAIIFTVVNGKKLGFEVPSEQSSFIDAYGTSVIKSNATGLESTKSGGLFSMTTGRTEVKESSTNQKNDSTSVSATTKKNQITTQQKTTTTTKKQTSTQKPTTTKKPVTTTKKTTTTTKPAAKPTTTKPTATKPTTTAPGKTLYYYTDGTTGYTPKPGASYNAGGYWDVVSWGDTVTDEELAAAGKTDIHGSWQ